MKPHAEVCFDWTSRTALITNAWVQAVEETKEGGGEKDGNDSVSEVWQEDRRGKFDDLDI